MDQKAVIEDIIADYLSFGVQFDEKIVRKAIQYAIKYHGTQKRASGEEYFYHPVEVAKIIVEMKLDTDSIVTAILHDTIEDTDLTYEDIEREFGGSIAKLVDGVTKLTKIKFREQNVRQAENFRKLLLAMSDDIRVLLVKLADRLHNMRTIQYITSDKKRERIALETMEIYAPLAERIGVQQIKTELQDISFEVINPEVKESIINRFDAIASSKDHMIDTIVTEIEKTVSVDGIKAAVKGRRKTPYSTWMKMKQKNVGLDQLSDIIAFRIIVDSVEACYRALGVIHSAYKMVPGNFQDFISIPKSNGYQSLHTVVMGPLQEKIEIQIRTQEMHEVAELGVAAHWGYKQGYDYQDGKKYRWIRELLSILEQTSDPEEFFQNTKMAMYYDQVFCFTPQGNLIALPKGATTIDFAYMVHSDIGNRCVGAKINGKIVPLRTQLVNGDQVEILTSKAQTVSPSWEKFVVTGKARGEIRKIVRIQQREQYIKLGKGIIEKAFKVAGIADHKKSIANAADYFKKSIEDLYFAIGEGAIAREDVVQFVKPHKSKLRSTLSLLKFRRKKQKSEPKHENAVPIKGLIAGMALHYAKCCHPLPGDRIAGVVHTGSGVTIHTADCEMLNNFAGMPQKIIDLTWDSNISNIPFVCRTKLLLLNEPASLATISTEIARDGGNITNFKIVNRNTDFFEMYFDIEVESLDHLEKIINTLRTKNVVQHVERFKM